MRILSFILAFTVVLLGPPFWGMLEAGVPAGSSLPGPGAFSYNGSSLNTAAPQLVIADAR